MRRKEGSVKESKKRELIPWGLNVDWTRVTFDYQGQDRETGQRSFFWCVTHGKNLLANLRFNALNFSLLEKF